MDIYDVNRFFCRKNELKSMNWEERRWPLAVWKKLSMIITPSFQQASDPNIMFLFCHLLTKISWNLVAQFCWTIKYQISIFVNFSKINPQIFKTHSVIGVLSDDTDPMVSVMKLEKAPSETYADVGGLDQQIQEIKVSVNFWYLFKDKSLLC